MSPGPICAVLIRVLPRDGHPSYAKCCHFFGLTPVYYSEWNPAEFRQLIDSNTVLFVATPCNVSTGIINNLGFLAGVDVPVHLDCCDIGFFLLFSGY